MVDISAMSDVRMPVMSFSWDCSHCLGIHTPHDDLDLEVWACLASLNHTYSQCVSWRAWLSMRMSEETSDETSIVSMLMMTETFDDQARIAKKLFGLRNKYVDQL